MRAQDWSVVGFGQDPVPGDPDYLRYGGRQYLDVAEAIDRTVQGLRSLQLDGTESEAIDALAETAQKVSDDIAKAEARYRATGNALIAYAGSLAQAQDASAQALARAQVAQSDAAAAQGDRNRYLRLAGDSDDPTEALRYERLADGSGADSRGASARISAARDDILQAQRDRDNAADRARERIENTTSGDGLKDSWWDNWGADVLAVITDVAGWVSAVAGILALVVSWIPVIGQALAAALLLVAGIAALVNAIGNIVLASSGERSWGEAIISIIGAALSVVGLGAAARIVGRAVAAGLSRSGSRLGVAFATPSTGVREAVGHARGNLAARSRINAAARGESGWSGEQLTVLESLRLKPSTMAESEALWATPVPAPANGDDAFRLWGNPPGTTGGSGAGGGSWTPTDPRGMTQVRELFGLPDVNGMTHLSVGTVTDASQALHVRHALPLDGMPGGGAEWVFRGGDPFDPLVGRVTTSQVPFP